MPGGQERAGERMGQESGVGGERHKKQKVGLQLLGGGKAVGFSATSERRWADR